MDKVFLFNMEKPKNNSWQWINCIVKYTYRQENIYKGGFNNDKWKISKTFKRSKSGNG